MSDPWSRGDHYRSVHDMLLPGLNALGPHDEIGEFYGDPTAWPGCIHCGGYFPQDSDHWNHPGHPRWWLRPGTIVEVPAAALERNAFDRLADWWRRAGVLLEDPLPGPVRRHARLLTIAVVVVALAILALSFLPVSVTNPPPQ